MSARAGAGAGAGAIVAAVLVIAGWLAIGPDHIIYALVVHVGSMVLGMVTGPLLVDTARRRYVVSAAEPRVYVLLGADAVRRLLGWIGWNRAIGDMREQGTGKTRLDRMMSGTERSETAHVIGAAATLVVGIAAAVLEHVLGAVQIILIGIVLHGYPIMIQRIVRARLARIGGR